MRAGKRYAEYRCDVCSAWIGQRGRVLFDALGRVHDAFCRPHRHAASFGRFER